MRTSCRGVALIAVLWVLAILTLWASVIAARSLGARRSVDRLAQAESTKYAADSAIRLALLRQTTTQGSQNSASGPLQIEGRQISVQMQGEAGRVDLNAAALGLIAAVFEQAGWPRDAAEALADRVAKRRGSSSVERASRETAGAGPSSAALVTEAGRFDSVDQLQSLSPDKIIAEDILDAFTVYTDAPEPSFTLAPTLVRGAVERLQGRRTVIQGNTAGTLVGQVLRIQACVQGEPVALCREVVGRISGSSSQLIQVFAWYTRWQ